MVLILKDNGLTCEAVHEMKQEAVEVCHESFDADPFSSESEDELAVSGDELGLGSQLDEDSRLMEGAEVKIGHDFRASDEGIKIGEMREVVHLESLVDGGIKFEKEVHPATPVNAVDEVVSEDLDYEREDGSEGSSGGMTDSSAESNVEIWPVESLEKLSQDIRNEKTLNEVVDADVNAELISAANGNRSTASGIHQNKCFDDHVSRYNRGPGLAKKGQMVGNSTRLRVWLSSVLLTLLVLLAALLAQHTYLSPALTGSLSSITTFFDQVKGCRDSPNTVSTMKIIRKDTYRELGSFQPKLCMDLFRQNLVCHVENAEVHQHSYNCRFSVELVQLQPVDQLRTPRTVSILEQALA